LRALEEGQQIVGLPHPPGEGASSPPVSLPVRPWRRASARCGASRRVPPPLPFGP
jgi:hypothetical protein